MSAVTQPIEPPAPPPQPPARAHTGRIVGGILLIVLGVGWLSDLIGLEFPWDVVLPAALIAIGVALLVVAGRGGSQSALVTAGVVVTVLVVLGSIVDVPFRGGIGERSVAPTSIAAVEDDYRLAIGDLTVDLGGVDDFASANTIREIELRVGIGHATLILPSSASVRVVAHAGLGNVQLDGQQASGFDVERSTVDGGDLDAVITVSVGLGQVDVLGG
jgi:predicted membrane protein